ncbi:hypothetical protein [Frankia sp. CcI49]|uniref:hypothetical protein n=1 Tax=Frankia sp. CcI49 TaxID=1745382 RepID=UPI001056A8A7|nr:hypothetical protein [Frankia sp. CcI49]
MTFVPQASRGAEYRFESIPKEALTDFIQMFTVDLFAIRLVRKLFTRRLELSLVIRGVSYTSLRRARDIEPWEESHLNLAAE